MDHKKWISEGKFKFDVASEKDIPDLIRFVQANFLRDEPIMRNTKIMEGSGFINRYLRNEIGKRLVTNIISKTEVASACIVARCTIDESILGCSMGEIVSRKNVNDKCDPPLAWIGNFTSILPMPLKLNHMINIKRR